MRKINEIIIHCSATREGKPFTAADIDRWHRAQGFQMVGYHYIVLLDGRIELGRPIAQIGAHCRGHNANSIGVCYIGGLTADGKHSKDTRTPQQRESLKLLLSVLRRMFPTASIHGHRDFAAKDCPCFDATSEYKDENSLYT